MALGEPPPAAGALSGLARRRLTGSTLFRVWRRRSPTGRARTSPWWFAPLADDPWRSGRFDLAAPLGTCYLATTLGTGLLEALRDAPALLPRAELDARRCAIVQVGAGAPAAAALTARAARGLGVTAELWAGGDRPLTQRWAAALRRDGWWALSCGAASDPTGQARSVALFDAAGEHEPTHAGGWGFDSVDLGAEAVAELGRYGITVLDADAELPIARPPQLG